MSTFLRLTLYACLALLALTRASAERLPNIVIIFIDDQGYADIGPFGAKGYSTPNLDRMAAEGRKFTNFHVPPPAPVCSRGVTPTVWAFMEPSGPKTSTGWRPRR